jgi:hypothetical protein
MVIFLAGIPAGFLAVSVVVLLPDLASPVALHLSGLAQAAVLIAVPAAGLLSGPIWRLVKRLRPGSAPTPAIAGRGMAWVGGCVVAYAIAAGVGPLVIGAYLQHTHFVW